MIPKIHPASPTAAALTALRSSPDGLSWSEARARLEEHGPNVAVPHAVPAWWRVLAKSFHNPFNYVLIFLGVVSYLTDDMRAATVMGLMIATATILRFTQEYRSLVKAESLRRLVRTKCSVLRQGEELVDRQPDPLDARFSEILVEDLALGDIVRLSAGDMVPADVLLIESRDLFVSQSVLTGEAIPVEKMAAAAVTASGFRESSGSRIQSNGAGDHANFAHENGSVPAAPLSNTAAPPNFDSLDHCFMGSSVVSGTAVALVLSTGPKTQMGQIGSRIAGDRPATSFDRGVNKVSWVLIRFMMVMVPIVFLINGLMKGNWLDAFFFGVAVAVGLTPEMLPMIVNANLARGAVSMAREKVVVKNMNAIQNLGAMNVLCTDKTGTLTQDKVVLIKHLDAEGTDSERVLEYAFLNSAFQTSLRNLIDNSIVDHAREHHSIRESARSFRRIDELPFDFVRRRMSVILEPAGGGPNLLVCKGAVDEMLEVCSQVETGREVTPLSEATRLRIAGLRDYENNDGLRLIAVAYKAVDKDAGEFSVADESQLIFCGLIAFLDPPKDSAAEALRLLDHHGVAVKILTGDNALVARKVCREVGLPVERVLSGIDVDQFTDHELPAKAAGATIFAKLTPAQKARVVRALKAGGHTVGFMGDGINDALALRESDVGISVDSAVDLAKEAADIILLEKSLLVLERGVVEGRRTFGNIIKYIKMTASSNFGNMFSVLVASAMLPFLPMLAIQILINNLLYDFSQISIPWDRMDEDWLRRPRQWSAPGIARFMIFVGPISSIFDITTFLCMWHLFGANSVERQSLFQTAWFVESLLTQTLVVHMIRTEKVPFLQSTASAPVLALTGVIMLVGCLIPFSPLGASLGMVQLPAAYWPFLAITLVAYCLLTQACKRLFIRKFGEWL